MENFGKVEETEQEQERNEVNRKQQKARTKDS